MRRFADATLRNRVAILDVLRRHTHAGDGVLEVASGSGQHAVYLAARLGVSWQPTDPDGEARDSIDAWRAWDNSDPAGAALAEGEGGGEIMPALALDVRGAWPAVKADVVVCVNMIHIAPWESTLALFDGAARLGVRVLYLYGPYKRAGVPTAASNVAFDGWLKARDPAFGVRDLESVVAEAAARGFALREVVEMPANNLSVVFGRG